MSELSNLYFNLGLQHICDIRAYDHILYLLALVALYRLVHWKKVIILATAFTIGHSLSLAINVYQVLLLSSKLVEVCIPLTIIATAIFNIYYSHQNAESKYRKLPYVLALIFGLIHGLGFSNFLKASLMPGEGMAVQLISFNLGIELGQIIIVTLILALNSFFIEFFKVKQQLLVKIISILAIIVSCKLLIDIV